MRRGSFVVDVARVERRQVEGQVVAQFRERSGRIWIGPRDPRDAPAIEKVLNSTFETVFDDVTIAAASSPMEKTARAVGGIDPGQKIYVSESDDTPFLLAAWWPWGNGETVSLRVGVRIEPECRKEQLPYFREYPNWITHK